MNAVLGFMPLFGLVGAVAGLTVALSRRTLRDEERWLLDRRKRERRNEFSMGPPSGRTDRRAGERRRAGAVSTPRQN